MKPTRHPIRIRWWIFAFMFSFALLSFVQRTSVAVAADTLMPSLHLSQFQIGLLNAAFLMTYTLMQIPSGILGQRFGARYIYFAAGMIGAVATLATPLMPFVATGTALFLALLLAQAMLGFSQAPVFPVFAGVVEAWFPANRWALANGLQSAGMLIGGAVTPLLIVSLTQSLGWQAALVSVALPVILVTLGWVRYGRNRPWQHPAVTQAELDELPQQPAVAPPPLTRQRLTKIIGDRNVLLLTLLLFMHELFVLSADVLVVFISSSGAPFSGHRKRLCRHGAVDWRRIGSHQRRRVGRSIRHQAGSTLGVSTSCP